MIGKDVTQLMDGIDFGGVEVKSFDFSATAGFEAKGYGIEPTIYMIILTKIL